VSSATVSRQLVILSREASRNGMAPLGARRAVLRDLFDYNTGPEREGDDVLYGPGIRIELAPGQDPLTQMLLTITEDEIAWHVIDRLSHRFNWKLLDPATGRVFNE
jgi:hypothetical protein